MPSKQHNRGARAPLIQTDNYVFTFGKYKGETFDKVATLDPCYPVWCHENVEWFRLPKTDYEALQADCAEVELSYGLSYTDLQE